MIQPTTGTPSVLRQPAQKVQRVHSSACCAKRGVRPRACERTQKAQLSGTAHPVGHGGAQTPARANREVANNLVPPQRKARNGLARRWQPHPHRTAHHYLLHPGRLRDGPSRARHGRSPFCPFRQRSPGFEGCNFRADNASFDLRGVYPNHRLVRKLGPVHPSGLG